MNRFEFSAASLPHGLMFFYAGRDGDFKGDTLKDDYNELVPLSLIDSVGYCQDEKGNEIDDQFKPVVRHIDTLNKECVQADYNDGKPFIPVVKLGWTQKLFVHQWSESTTEAALANLSFEDGMQLLKFHFWPNKPEGEEVVYVSDEFNPYK